MAPATAHPAQAQGPPPPPPPLHTHTHAQRRSAPTRPHLLDQLARGLAARGQLAERLLRRLDQRAVVHGPRRRHHHARRGVVCGNVVGQVLACDGTHVFGGAQDGAAQRRVLEGGGVQVVKDDLLRDALHLRVRGVGGAWAAGASSQHAGRSLARAADPPAPPRPTQHTSSQQAPSRAPATPTHLLHLPQDDVALPLNRPLLQVAVLQDVGQDVQRRRHILLKHLGVVAGLQGRGRRGRGRS